VALGAFLSGTSMAADILILEGGSRIEVEEWWRDGELLMYRKYGGTVGIPFSKVLEVDEGSDGTDRLSGSPGAPGSYASPKTETPAALPPADISPTPDLDRRIQELEARARSEPSSREALHREIALLWTQAGNERYREGDPAAARSAYETAVGLHPELSVARLNLASVYLSLGRNAEALAHANQVLAANPDHSDALVTRGEALYRSERVEEALDAWRHAQELDPDPRTADRIDKALREQSVGGEFFRSDGAHFTLRYDGRRSDAKIGDEILRFLDDQFNELVQRYNHLPASSIVVILYPASQFHEVTQSPDWTGGLFDGKIRVPVGGVQGLSSGLRRTLVHELTHAFVFSMTRANCSRWLQEGLAQYQEGKTVPRSVTTGLARQYRQGSPRWGLDLDYSASLALTHFLVDRYGFASLVGILEALGDGASEDRAVRQVLGIDMESVLRQWGDALVNGEGA
jgi:tetratricopeptide (TPR) repeat protein